MRRHLQHAAPSGQRLCLFTGTFMQFGLAEPAHKVPAVDVNSCIQRLHFAFVITLRAPCGCNISPQRARHSVMHNRRHEQALRLGIASGAQCKHALAVQLGRFRRWCAIVHKANACHLPLETARSMMSWRLIIATFGTTARGLRIAMTRRQMSFICVM